MFDVTGVSNLVNSITSNIFIGADDWLYDTLIVPLLTFFIKIIMRVFQFSKTILRLILDIADIDFLRAEYIEPLMNRLYIVLGVVMLFKITISCIQYLINPDKGDDKENGAASIIKRVIISVALLALVPTIFDFAKTAQNKIADIIPKVVLGGVVTSDDVGESIAYSTVLGCVGYKDASSNDGSIAGLKDKNGNVVASGAKISTIDDVHDNAELFVESDTIYRFEWFPAILCSLFLCYILLSFTIDIGVRTVKLGFLQIIAPIPIASYIDPKTSKKSFDSWKNNCINVYLDLFIRLIVIYFIIYLFTLLFSSFALEFPTSSGETITGLRAGLIDIAIIISLFFFAKQAPKFICDILGIKGDGNIKDMFTRAGGLLGSQIGTGKAGVASMINKAHKIRDNNQKGKTLAEKMKNAGSIVGDGARSGFASSRSGARAFYKNKGFKDAMNSANRSGTRAYDLHEELVDNNVKYTDYLKEVAKNKMGIQSVVESSNKEIKAAKGSSDIAKATLDYVSNNASTKFPNVDFQDINMKGGVSHDFMKLGTTISIGLDEHGNEVKINTGDLITAYKKDANGNVLRDSFGNAIVEDKAKYSVAEVMDMLKNVQNDASGKYDGVNARYKTQATGVLDTLSGIVNKYVVNNANNKDANIPSNPAFARQIQDAVSEFMQSSGTTEFGRAVMDHAKSEGWLNSSGVPKETNMGDFLAYVKSEGQKHQTAQKQEQGKQGAGFVAKGIAEKYDKKN